MKNNKKTITPNEINKYVYCPYQWYYERKYGSKKLRELYKIRNEEYGYADTTKSNFKKGIEFHNTYFAKEKFKKFIIITILIILILLLIYLKLRF